MRGWCKDEYGLWWQFVPDQLGELKGDPDPEKSQRVMPSHVQDAADYRRRPARANVGK